MQVMYRTTKGADFILFSVDDEEDGRQLEEADAFEASYNFRSPVAAPHLLRLLDLNAFVQTCIWLIPLFALGYWCSHLDVYACMHACTFQFQGEGLESSCIIK